MIRLLALLIVALASFSFVQGQQTRPTASTPSTARFTTLDILIDPQGQPLAAYQFEFAAETKGVTLVGIESGEHSAFAKAPPYYDPAALNTGRVIVAAFSTDADLPSTKTRVARLHLLLEADAAAVEHPQYALKLQAAANAEGKSIGNAKLTFSEGAQP